MLKGLTVNPTYRREMDWFGPHRSLVADKIPEDIRIVSDSLVEEYALELRAVVHFRCPPENLHEGILDATRRLMRGVYADLLPMIHDMRSALMAKDAPALGELIERAYGLCTDPEADGDPVEIKWAAIEVREKGGR